LLFCDILRNKTIFVAPLDWGFGHATRCVPLIKNLKENNTVILGITPVTSPILNEEFPDLKKVNIEPYNVNYSGKLSVTLKLVTDLPRILTVIRKEHQQLIALVRDLKLDVVISDNRFGLFHPEVKCIYMTHQLNIQAGIFSWMADRIHSHYLKRFHEIWVPDFKEETKSLAGKLSRSKRLNVLYLGPLSRVPQVKEIGSKQYNYLILLSGPEPLRTVFEKKLLERAEQTMKSLCLIRGTNKPKQVFPKNVTVYDLANAHQIADLIQRSETVICRSGYSTLMDLHSLDKTRVILVPTPGQSEQIYLAQYWAEKFNAQVVNESDLETFCF
jgi:uncharacterized protein (TIGR00661 family)